MRVSFASIGRASVAAAALAIAASGLAVSPAVAKDPPKEAAKATVSPEFAKGADAFQKALVALDGKKTKLTPDELKQQAAPLQAQLAAMDSSVKNAVDREYYGRWQYAVSLWTGDKALANKGLQNMLDSGRTGAQEPQVRIQLGQNAYQAENYPAVITLLTPLLTDPKEQDVVVLWIADSYAKLDKPKEGLAALKTAIAARKAAKVAVSEDLYARGKIIAYNAKLNEDAVEWSQLLVADAPTPFNWLSAGEFVLFNATNWTSQEELDVFRLLDQAGALKLEPKYTTRKFVAYLQLVDPRRYPGEAVRIAEQGIASGALKADDQFVKDALTQARPRIAGDKASLPGLAKEAASAPTGKVAQAAGDTFLSYGDAAKAEELYALALTKGVAEADKDRLLTRLGIAQIESGKYADGKATLAKVGAVRAPIARLWTIYADQKAAGN